MSVLTNAQLAHINTRRNKVHGMLNRSSRVITALARSTSDPDTIRHTVRSSWRTSWTVTRCSKNQATTRKQKCWCLRKNEIGESYRAREKKRWVVGGRDNKKQQLKGNFCENRGENCIKKTASSSTITLQSEWVNLEAYTIDWSRKFFRARFSFCGKSKIFSWRLLPWQFSTISVMNQMNDDSK